MVQQVALLELEKKKQAIYDPFLSTSKLGYNTHDKNLLVVSPYNEPNHLLDISQLDRPYQLLTRALQKLRPATPSYATTNYKEAFNWDEVVETLRLQLDPDEDFEDSFFIIVFRSQVPLDVSRPYLGILDREAHVEATKAGGLLKYWFGVPDENGRNLATCVWRHRSDAKLGGAGPGHRRAMQEAIGLYLEWKVERLRLVISDRGSSWDIVEWKD